MHREQGASTIGGTGETVTQGNRAKRPDVRSGNECEQWPTACQW
jgi:hypothetical protein